MPFFFFKSLGWREIAQIPMVMFAAIVAVSAFGQAGMSTAVVTLGAPSPVVGQPFTVWALVTNPSLSPAPTGSIQFDFGDGSPTVTVAMGYRVASATHTYAAVGSAKMKATYSGDANFAPASAVVQGEILRSVPSVQLNVFGDSISASGNRVDARTVAWANMVAYVHGWTLNNVARPGQRTADQCQYIYGTTIVPTSYSAVLLGANDIWWTTPPPPLAVNEYQSSLLACSAWLLIPGTAVDGTHPKVIAQDALVQQSGTWTQSSLYPAMGLSTTTAGDSLTTNIAGSAIYLGLSGTKSSNYTVDVSVDGQPAGEYTPVFYYSGDVTTAVPWGVRVPIAGSSQDASHEVRVVCKSPGLTGCNVDWLGGNGFAAPNLRPLLWLGEPYTLRKSTVTYAEVVVYVTSIRQIGQYFQVDGLGVTLSDVFDNFDAVTDAVCSTDGIHPDSCGQQILASTFLGTMDWLFTKDQRIDFGSETSISYSSSPIPIDVTSTSGLPVSLKAISGPATASGNTITPTGIGSVILQADQAGDASYLPAATEERTLQIAPAPVTVSLSPSATNVIYPRTVSLEVAVTSNGNDAVPGTVTLNDGEKQLRTASLNANGTAAFNNVQLVIGSHTLSVAFNASNGNYLPAVSPTVSISVVSVPTVTINPSSASVSKGQTLSVSVVVNGGSGSAIPTGSVTITSGSHTSGAATLSSGATTITIPGSSLAIGSNTLTATYSPDSIGSVFYTTATATVNITVNKATPTLTWAAPAAITYGTALGATQLHASSGVAGAFTYNPATGTILTAGTHQLSVTFTPTDNTDYTTATATVNVTVNKVTPTLTWAAPAAITYGTALGTTQLHASSGGVVGAFTYNPMAGTILTAGTHQLSVTFTPTDNTDYTTATATVNVTVNKVTPTLTWAAPAAITYGTALGATQLHASSGVAGAFTYNPAAGTILTAGTQQLSVTFTPTDNIDYTTATATVKVTVNRAVPAVQVAPSSSSITTAQAFSAMITVNGGNGTVMPTGSVAMTSGTFTSGHLALSYGNATINIPAGSLSAGTDTLSAVYTPDAAASSNYMVASGETSVTVTTAKLTPAVSVSPASTSISTAQSVAVTVVINGGAGNPLTTGTVTLSSGNYASSGSAVTNGTATITVPAGSLATGNDTLTATFTPDASSSAVYNTASGTASLTVAAAAYSMSATAVTIAPGGSATSTVTVSSINGYAGTVSLGCSITASPAGATVLPTCSATQPVTLSPTATSATATVTVNSTAASAALTWPNVRNGRGLAVTGSAALALLLLPWIPWRRRNLSSLIGVLIAMTLVAGLAACGGGGSSTTPLSNPGTTKGSYTITVTGAGNDSAKTTASTTFTLKVN